MAHVTGYEPTTIAKELSTYVPHVSNYRLTGVLLPDT